MFNFTYKTDTLRENKLLLAYLGRFNIILNYKTVFLIYQYYHLK
nr:MAG TPA: hypothetical protein [Crassvirales sp.]